MLYPYVPTHIPSVGNRTIDSNHRKIFEIICRIQRSIITRESAALNAEFRVFEDFVRAYFSIEEKIARAVGFDFAEHDLAHRDLLEKYRLLRGELAAKNGSWSDAESDAYLTMLCDWLTNHLAQESKPLMFVLDTYLYDFMPEQAGTS